MDGKVITELTSVSDNTQIVIDLLTKIAQDEFVNIIYKLLE